MTSQRVLRIGTPLLAFASLLLASGRDACALTLLSDDRIVRITQSQDPLPPVVISATPDVPFGPFHYGDRTGPAYQDSELTFVDDPGGFDSLKGSVGGGTDSILPDADDSAERESVFSIHFRIDGPSSALVKVFGGMYGVSSSTQELTCVLLFAGPNEIVAGRCSNPFDFNFSFSTSIDPGDYELRATAPGHRGEGGGAYGFDFSIAENVPEPGTALLLALGMAGLRGAAMRRGRSGT